MSTRRLLLISNSNDPERGILGHCGDEIRDFLGAIETVLFVPYAQHDWDGVTNKTRARFRELGIALSSIHESEAPETALRGAESIYICGGNTFRLLHKLQEQAIMPVIREKVSTGTPYIGTSAGSNVATLNIKTTNDMPIVEPMGFDGLGLVNFNLNPHYLDPDPNSTHQGETREQRIREFLEDNQGKVIGVREGAWLRVEGMSITLGGKNGARYFTNDAEPTEHRAGDRLDFLEAR